MRCGADALPGIPGIAPMSFFFSEPIPGMPLISFFCDPASAFVPGMPLISFMAGALSFDAGELAGAMPGIDSMSFWPAAEAAGVGLGVGDAVESAAGVGLGAAVGVMPGIPLMSVCADASLCRRENAATMNAIPRPRRAMDLLSLI